GIRGQETGDDQKRTGSAKVAVANGADFLVIGRPVYQSSNPVKTVNEILKEMGSG
ncbi:MAG: orotidine 5'-phosphate decarboxylase, partial [Candidatus Omnitrophica bacterium]|nr:orotidine 5'-phosphate decarboxylase [Candidatus Omnitrophota bacterium]